MLRPGRLDDLRQVPQRTEYRRDPLVGMVVNRIVVDEPDRNQPHLRHRQETLLEPSSDATASDYQRRCANQALAESFAAEAPERHPPETNQRRACEPQQLDLSTRNPGARLVAERSVGGTIPALVQALGAGAPVIALDTPFNR